MENIPTIITVEGQLYEATNPINQSVVNSYVDFCNQQRDLATRATEKFEAMKTVIETIIAQKPELKNEAVRTLLGLPAEEPVVETN